MDKIVKFFECLIPETVCNLRCSYCYVVQRSQNTQKIPQLDYPIERIKKALTSERLGGKCLFSICGAGETFVPDYLIDIVYVLLENGHYVNVTTNGTLTNKIHKLETIPYEWRCRLHISFSFHYLELKRTNRLDAFFDNINYVKGLGCSILVQVNLCDEYIPVIKEIQDICIDRVGAKPQLAATRKEYSLSKKIELMTENSDEEYVNNGKSFESPLFDFTMKNFNVKRKEFCYAGAWAYTLNFKTGVLKRCYASCIHQNIFKDTEKPLINCAVGNRCGSLFCLNSSHFMSLGTIPTVDTPTYADLRDRANANWMTPAFKSFVSKRLYDNNRQYGKLRKIFSNCLGTIDNLLYSTYQHLKKK